MPCGQVHIATASAAIVLTMVFAGMAEARGSKAERLDKVLNDMDRALEQRQVLKENEEFANAHPEEAKQCFDPMMAAADQYGVERHVYFTDNQPYFRDCIERLLAAKK